MSKEWSKRGAAPKERQRSQSLPQKLARERHTTEEIAALLPAYKCPPIDIDAELKKPPVPAEACGDRLKKHKSRVLDHAGSLRAF